MRHVTAGVLAAALTTTSLSVAVAAPTTSPERVATAPTMAKNTLDTHLQTMVDGGALGASAAIRQGDQVWMNTAGAVANPHMNITKGFATSRAASITKTVTAVLVLQEMERGTWTLDTQVGEVDPTLIPAHPEVTIRQLLSHTSGLPDYLGMPTMTDGLLQNAKDMDAIHAVATGEHSNKSLMQVANTSPWRFEPGTRFDYSNSNYVALSLLLEKVTGKSFRYLALTRVFGPVSMMRSDVPEQPGLQNSHLMGAMMAGDRVVMLPDFSPTLFGAAGNMTTNVMDLTTFQRALTSGRLISKESLALMQTPTPQGQVYGLGMFRIQDPCSSAENPKYLYGHDGAGFGEFSISLARPNGEESFSVLWTGRRYDDRWREAFSHGWVFLFDWLKSGCASTELDQVAGGHTVERDEFVSKHVNAFIARAPLAPQE